MVIHDLAARESETGLQSNPLSEEEEIGQEGTGIWWMPWHRAAKKDVVSCEKLRRDAHDRRPADIRMGQPVGIRIPSPRLGGEQTRGTETSKYPEEEKVRTIS